MSNSFKKSSANKTNDRQKEFEYIAEKKRLEYEAAQPYMKPVINEHLMDEAEIRQRVRDAILNMPEEERDELRSKKRKAYTEIVLSG